MKSTVIISSVQFKIWKKQFERRSSSSENGGSIIEVLWNEELDWWNSLGKYVIDESRI